MFEKKVKILLIDDRPENLHAMKMTLQPLEDVEIFTAQSGNEGLSIMLEHEFAVVLLDVQMPEMDGFETAALMQNHKATENTPIIFVTAISKEKKHVFKGYKTGAVDYLFKPITPEILLSKVKVFIKLFKQRKDCERMQKELQKINNLEALGVLAGGIAHDFNNLLTSIFGYIELAKLKSGPESEISKNLNEAVKAAVRAKQLTHQLLTFSKGGGPIKENADIADLIKDTSTLLLSGSNVKILLDIESHLADVEVDRGQVNQVFQNLMLNAKEAMPDGGKLTIKAENITVDDDSPIPLINNGKYVKITFSDDGPGIDQALLSKIFDPYFSSKSRGASNGQGLGLAISHSIIKKHGGYIYAESKLGEGAAFHIYLPVSVTKKHYKKKAETSFSGLPASSARENLLIMEDETTVAHALSDMLQYLGYDTQIVPEGKEAIQAYSQAKKDKKPFDAVILDLTIRGGEGGEKVLEKLRNIDPEIKAIVASGYGENPIMSNYKEYGFTGAIKKPFTLTALADAVKKAL